MATPYQSYRKPKSVVSISYKILYGFPQSSARIISFLISAPSKPNSASRKTMLVSLVSGYLVQMKLTGGGQYPAKFAVILLTGFGYSDTPGVNYSVVRGALECQPLMNSSSSRFKFGGSG